MYRAGAGSQPDPPRQAARAAVDDLFRVHAIGLVRFALMLVGDQTTAEDVVQEAFLGLYRGWDRLRDPDAVLGYLRTAVVNGARSVISPRHGPCRPCSGPRRSSPPDRSGAGARAG